MRKLIAGFASSLDGYIEGPKGEYDWILIDKEIDFAEHAKRFDTYFYGRKSYEKMLSVGIPVSKEAKHYVFSTTLTEVADGYMLIKDNIAAEVARVKQQEGKAIAVFGGANLLTSLLNHQLVDEISVSVIPVLLGSGRSMIEAINERVWLELVATRSYLNGTVELTYTVKNII
jgi:dihydrofolate reductase